MNESLRDLEDLARRLNGNPTQSLNKFSCGEETFILYRYSFEATNPIEKTRSYRPVLDLGLNPSFHIGPNSAK